MRFSLISIVLSVVLVPGFARAQDRAGEFDYYVLALSWTPNWCTREGDARGSAQCAADSGHGWTLHGLWPQYDRGWPQNCQTNKRPPSRTASAEMADIMGSRTLGAYQWRKHGSCSGLGGDEYLSLSREAYDSIKRPEVLRQLDREVALPASVIEEAFLKDNPRLKADMLTVTCRDGQIGEVRVCLSKALVPRFCGPDVIRDCSMEDALFSPLR